MAYDLTNTLVIGIREGANKSPNAKKRLCK